MRFLSRRHLGWQLTFCSTHGVRPLCTAHSQTATTATVTLRPYQQECINVCLARLQEGIQRQAVSLPVGSGKTVIFSHLIARIPPRHPMATQVLVLAHREELLHQACRQIARHAPHLKVDLEQGSNYAATNADVIVASVASLGRQNSPRLQRLDPQRFKAIIIDEAHHAVADTYLRVLRHFDAMHAQTSIFVWGCSATLKRHDHLALSQAFDYISFHLDFTRMIEEKWLCHLKAVSVHTGSDISNVRKVAGDFAIKQLSH
ncbi:DEAD DEAH box helicase [Dimargaris xerosporica]|nr:DEAD DEAH box helicase [Dimargaris xerosporica]